NVRKKRVEKFNEKWEAEYLFLLQAERQVCLLCHEAVSVMNDYNLHRHFPAKHRAKYATVASKKNVTFRICSEKHLFLEGAFLKHCMLKVCEQVFPEQMQAYKSIFFTRKNIPNGVKELSSKLRAQLAEEMYSYQIQRSYEVLDVTALHNTITGRDVFEVVERSLVGLTIDGAPAMCGEKAGLVGLIKEKLNKSNCLTPLITYHCIIHQEALCGKVLDLDNIMATVFQPFLKEVSSKYEYVPYQTEMRSLSESTELKRFFELRKEIALFMQIKGKPMPEISDPNWLLQRRRQVITWMYDVITTFQHELHLWKSQMEQKILSFRASQPHFLVPLHAPVWPPTNRLINEFLIGHFSDLRTQHSLALVSSPILSLPIDSDLIVTPALMPQLRLHAAYVLSLFGSTYLCEGAVFSHESKQDQAQITPN
uniref:SPIN-DOC-like zinc-finger domain-containing protein n=1 Tax=Mola mola TaxID=94237 RepID=A0A3Q4BQ04_MOLML